MLERFPLYTDLLQPVALAVYEIRAGLAMVVAAVQQQMQHQQLAVQSDLAVSLMALPISSSGGILVIRPGRALNQLHSCCLKMAADA